jgi:UPF0042 nucleotide-binding protein
MENFVSKGKPESCSDSENSLLTRRVEIWSFGYKYGAMDADAVFDVRFLPNPYYIETLCHFTGKDSACSAFVLQNADAQDFVEKLAALILAMRASADVHKKPAIKIAVGCTGGQHRSVAVAEEVAKRLQSLRAPGFGLHLEVHHRDAENWMLSEKSMYVHPLT